MKIESELSEHTKALDDHQRESMKAWEAHKAAKLAEDRERAIKAAARAQDPNQGTSSDYDLAA